MMLKNFFLLAVLAFQMSGCAEVPIEKYEPTKQSAGEIAKAKGVFEIGEIQAIDDVELANRLKGKTLSCRATTFHMPDDVTVGAYIKRAFTDELAAAHKLSKKGKKIDITVKELELVSGFDKGNWTLDFDYLVGGQTISVRTETEFDSAFATDTACHKPANALSDAMRENLLKFFQEMRTKKP